MTRPIPALEAERVVIRELTMDDLVSINDVLNEATGSEMPVGERQRWLQWTVLGYEMFDMLGTIPTAPIISPVSFEITARSP